MARERVISAEHQSRDGDRAAVSLRPRLLSEITGQRQIVDQLRIAIEAARKRGEPLEHILLDGPPGLGKTTMANVIATEFDGRDPKITSGPALNKTSDLMSVLTNLEHGDVLFIDEVHRLPTVVEEFLYPAMEDFRVDYTIEGGLGGRTISFALQRFTLIGATTRAGLLSAAMRDRFGLRYHFEFYGEEDLATILRRSARLLDIPADDSGLRSIARRSRGTPRVANRLLRRVRDYAQVRADGLLTEEIVHEGLDIQRIDQLGLDDLDRTYLTALIEVYGGGPAGIEALAATTGQERDTLEDVVEPYLLQLGFVIRTRQGRQATAQAYQHLNIPYISDADPKSQAELFS
ncbi:MAG: Holliday junction branch migration DNA helicase RuvB [Planctomycetes bacterium]|nr:Holliday junction branch migration DNA helicase RuvB [Planctomycetota bacterium]